jgi:phosphoribosylaminoimidazolecarboxamide formyltransferase / IMP cyclohydrolase
MSAGVAYLSTAHKQGVAEFAHDLSEMGWDLFASQGTQASIQEAGVPVGSAAELIGEGYLFGQKAEDFDRELQANIISHAIGTGAVELVYVTLKPVWQLMDRSSIDRDRARAKVDLGGVAMLAAGAANRRIVVSSSTQLPIVSDWLVRGKPNETKFLDKLAGEALGELAQYADEVRHATVRPDVLHRPSSIPPVFTHHKPE